MTLKFTCINRPVVGVLGGAVLEGMSTVGKSSPTVSARISMSSSSPAA